METQECQRIHLRSEKTDEEGTKDTSCEQEKEPATETPNAHLFTLVNQSMDIPIEEERAAPKMEQDDNPPKVSCYPQIPFRKRLEKKQHDEQFLKFLKNFKNVKINIPFLEVRREIPRCNKILKDLLTKKKQFLDNEKIIVKENVSAII